MIKTTQFAFRIGTALTACLAATAVVLFILSSFWGGFRVHFPIQKLSITDPVRPLLAALLFAGLYYVLCRRSDSADVEDTPDAMPSSDAETSLGALRGWILFIGGLLVVRYTFKAYEPTLMGGDANPALLALVPLMIGAAGVGAWRAGLCALRGGASRVAWFPVLLWSLSPLAVPLDPVTVFAYWVAAGVQPASPSARTICFRRPLYDWIVIVLCAALLVGYLGSVGPGWAGGRVRHEITDRFLSGIWLVLCAGGLVTLARTHSVFRAPARRTGYLALLGVAVAGTRGVWGIAGTLWILPLAAVLLTEVLHQIDRHVIGSSRCLARNVVQLALVGLLAGFIGHNLLRPIRPPRAPAEAAPAAQPVEDLEDISKRSFHSHTGMHDFA